MCDRTSDTHSHSQKGSRDCVCPPKPGGIGFMECTPGFKCGRPSGRMLVKLSASRKLSAGCGDVRPLPQRRQTAAAAAAAADADVCMTIIIIITISSVPRSDGGGGAGADDPNRQRPAFDARPTWHRPPPPAYAGICSSVFRTISYPAAGSAWCSGATPSDAFKIALTRAGFYSCGSGVCFDTFHTCCV